MCIDTTKIVPFYKEFLQEEEKNGNASNSLKKIFGYFIDRMSVLNLHSLEILTISIFSINICADKILSHHFLTQLFDIS